MTRHIQMLALLSLLLTLAACGGGGNGNGGTNARGGEQAAGEPEYTFAYVTNGVDPFWYIAQAGAERAGDDLNCEVLILMPPTAQAEEQNRMMEELVARGVDGVAVSPISAEDQNGKINEIAEYMHVITHDSDAPASDRLVFIGVDNYAAGRMVGELTKEAMPGGGDVMIFIGRLEQANARLRTQGVIDELLDRDWDPTRFDEPGQTLVGEKFTVLDVRTDSFSSEKALAQAEDALARFPEIDGMIGLFAYNPPAILNALQKAGKLDEVTVIGFDEQDPTLQGIKDGHVYGTVVQNPYMYGYESIRVLKEIARGNMEIIPENEMIEVPARKITAENVDEFWADLREKRGDT